MTGYGMGMGMGMGGHGWKGGREWVWGRCDVGGRGDHRAITKRKGGGTSSVAETICHAGEGDQQDTSCVLTPIDEEGRGRRHPQATVCIRSRRGSRAGRRAGSRGLRIAVLALRSGR